MNPDTICFRVDDNVLRVQHGADCYKIPLISVEVDYYAVKLKTANYPVLFSFVGQILQNFIAFKSSGKPSIRTAWQGLENG